MEVRSDFVVCMCVRSVRLCSNAKKCPECLCSYWPAAFGCRTDVCLVVQVAAGAGLLRLAMETGRARVAKPTYSHPKMRFLHGLMLMSRKFGMRPCPSVRRH